MMRKLCFLVFILQLSTWSLHARNLYPGDPGAETEPDTLSQGVYSSGLLPWSWDDNVAFEGKRSIRIDWDGKRRLVVPAGTDASKRWFDIWHSLRGPELEIGETYTFSFYAKSSLDEFPLELILMSNAGWPYDVENGTHLKKFVITGKEWKRYSYTFVAKFHEKAPVKGYAPIFGFRDSPAGSFWYDAVQMEKGETATPYKAPDAAVGIHLVCGNPYNIYTEGEKITGYLRVNLQQGQEARLIRRVIDYRGQEVDREEKNIASGGEYKLEPDPGKLGWYKIVAELLIDGKMRCSHAVNYINVKKPVANVKGIQPYAGLINYSGFDVFDVSRKIGAKRLQVEGTWGEYYYNNGIETAPDKFDWTAFEWELRRGRENGMLNKVIVNPFTAPKFHFDTEEWNAAKAVGGSLVLDSGKHRYWVHFIAEMMKRFGGMIDEVEFGAEDNGKLGHNAYYMAKYPDAVKPDSKGANWLVGGKPFDNLCTMVKLAAAETRRHRPDMKIGAIRPSEGLANDDWFFVRAMFKEIGRDFNIFPVDPYFMPYNYGPDIIHRNGTVEDRFAAYESVKKITRELGNDQPVYISECGMAIDVRYPDESVYRQEQAETTAKDMIVSRIAGYYAYDFFVGFGGTDGIGPYTFFMTQCQKIQSVAAAYSAAAQIVENITEGDYRKPDRVTRIALMRKHDGRGVAAIWADKGYLLQSKDLNSPALKITDLMGNPVEAADGKLPLSTAPVYLWHPDYRELAAMADRFTVEQTDFCKIMFRMTSREKGRLKIINSSNTKDLELNLKITAGGRESSRTVDIPRGSYSICEIPLDGKNITVAAARATGQGTMVFSFTVPEPAVIGNAMHTVAKVEMRSDIYPPSDPWVTWSGPEDLSADIRASWDADKLELLFLVKDDRHFNKFKTATYMADSIQVALDPKNNGEFYIAPSGKPLGPDHLEFGLSLGDDGQVYRNVSHGRKEIIDVDTSTVSRDEKNGITTYRISLPWSKLGVKPHKGMIFGMSFIIFDDDTNTGHNYYAPIGAGIAGNKNPAAYKKFILE